MVAYDKGKAKENRRKSTVEVLEALRAAVPDVVPFARVVGRWVWIQFEAKPPESTRGVLLGLGFHWNRSRAAWQHPCGRFSGRSRGDPRDRYGSVPVAADDPAVQAS